MYVEVSNPKSKKAFIQLGGSLIGVRRGKTNHLEGRCIRHRGGAVKGESFDSAASATRLGIIGRALLHQFEVTRKATAVSS